MTPKSFLEEILDYHDSMITLPVLSSNKPFFSDGVIAKAREELSIKNEFCESHTQNIKSESLVESNVDGMRKIAAENAYRNWYNKSLAKSLLFMWKDINYKFTAEEARIFFDSNEWRTMDQKDICWLQIEQDCLCVPLNILAAAFTTALNRPVSESELQKPLDSIRKELVKVSLRTDTSSQTRADIERTERQFAFLETFITQTGEEIRGRLDRIERRLGMHAAEIQSLKNKSAEDFQI